MLDADKLSPASPEDLAAACVLPWASRSIEILSPDGRSSGRPKDVWPMPQHSKGSRLWGRPARGNEKPAWVIRDWRKANPHGDALSLSLSRLRESSPTTSRAKYQPDRRFLPRTSGDFPPRAPRQRQMSRLSLRPKPRVAVNPTRTTCRKFDRDDPKTTHDRAPRTLMRCPCCQALPSRRPYPGSS